MAPAKLPRSTIALYAALAVLFAIALTHRIRDTTDRLEEVVRGDRLVRLPFDGEFTEMVMSDLQPEAEAAGLRSGDRITAVEGRPLDRLEALIAPLMTAAPGERLNVESESTADGRPVRRDASIVLAPMREGPPRLRDWTQFAIGNVALPYLSLLLGFWVAAARIRDKVAWIVLALLVGLSEFVGGGWRTSLGRDDWFQPIAMVYQPLVDTLWPVNLMLFGIYFPERLNFDRRFPWVRWIILLPVVLYAFLGIVISGILLLYDLERAAAIARVARPLLPIALTLDFVAVSYFLAASGYRAFRERRPDVRRRLMLLCAGATVSLAPICVLAALLLTGVVPFADWMLLPVNALLLLFPATMAYVIVVHRAMDVRLVIRQGVQYLLARGTVRAIQFAVSAVIVVAIATQAGPFAARDQAGVQILIVGAALMVIVQIRRIAERVRRAVDRRFFREAYDSEQILADLANKVRTMVETRPLLEMVAHQIATSLHVPRVAILLSGEGALQPAYALGYHEVPAVPLRPGHRERRDGPPERYISGDEERTIRETLDAELVLPLSANQKLIGVMGLGPKRSEEPFTSADIRLLGAVAVQTGLALENSRLAAEIAAEVAEREKAKREIEIAREVQERLFPQELPSIRGLEYQGTCRPALGIGGDYYDFIPLSDSEFGIAIGDVSGKGIPAALLMATLRAYLRGQTIRGDSDLAAMIANLNRLVYESSAPNRYATFFYGQYDSNSHLLKYVNAGHNPPMLFKRSGGVVRLDVGGPVVGLITGCTYQQGCVTLDAGDVLVGYTDGVSEAMNGEMVEWGEERLMAAVLPQRGLASPDLIARIMSEADGFVAGAPQHDDMTVVVVRRTG